MRDNLPRKVKKYECGIVNLDSSAGPGTHWVAYCKKGTDVQYFDSFGNLRPPQEIVQYLGKDIKYNHSQYQNYNSSVCGHLCLKFLYSCCCCTSSRKV